MPTGLVSKDFRQKRPDVPPFRFTSRFATLPDFALLGGIFAALRLRTSGIHRLPSRRREIRVGRHPGLADWTRVLPSDRASDSRPFSQDLEHRWDTRLDAL